MKQILPLSFRMLIGLLLVAGAAKGQNQPLITSFQPAEVSAPIDDYFTIDLKVSNFDSIVTFQFPVVFDRQILELSAVEGHPALPGFNGSNYTPIEVVNNGPGGTMGRIVFTWYVQASQVLSGYSLPDGATLLSLTFKVKSNGKTVVGIANVSPGIEVTRGADLQMMPVRYQEAAVSVLAGSGIPNTGSSNSFKLKANHICIPPGEKGCMPITVENFTKLLSLQFATHWNPALLRFDSARNLSLPGWTTHDMVADQAKGLLKTIWGTPTGLSMSLPNGTVLYEICFTALGPQEAADVIRIDGNGFTAEAVNEAGINQIKPGFGVADTLYINHCPTQALTAVETPEAALQSVRLSPNPFEDATQISFELQETTEVSWRVSDLSGREVYRSQATYPEGAHKIELSGAQLGAKGAYFLTLQGKGRAITRLIFFQ